jgi:hypothetical protein
LLSDTDTGRATGFQNNNKKKNEKKSLTETSVATYNGMTNTQTETKKITENS